MSFDIAVLVSGEGTNLQALLDTVHGREGIEIVAVAASRADAGGLARAERAGVETGVFTIGEHGGREERDRALADWLDERGPALLVLAGFMEVLTPEFIRRFAGRMINVHPALLPAFPGVRAIEQALEYGVKVFGVTVHFVDEGVDTGPIIAQRALELPDASDAAQVREALRPLEHDLLCEAVLRIARGGVHSDPAHPRHVTVER